MKALFSVGVFLWIMCGFAGDCMVDGIGDLHWKEIARGPLTLMEGFQDDPVTVPALN